MVLQEDVDGTFKNKSIVYGNSSNIWLFVLDGVRIKSDWMYRINETNLPLNTNTGSHDGSWSCP